MLRALSLYLPWWSIQRLKREGAAREANRCMLLVRTLASRQIVIHACPLALRAGVRPGMTLAHAQAMLPDRSHGKPQVLEHDPERDGQSLAHLARWATRFAPKVQVDGDDGLLMDVTGCARLYQGEQNLLTQLLRALKQLGFTAKAVIAPTFGAAWALARFSQHFTHSTSEGAGESGVIERPDQMVSALSPLPVRALRIDEETAHAMSEVGVNRIGEILDLPRNQLPSRFSDDLMLRIDQALGHAMETITPVRVPHALKVDRQFEGPVKNIEAIQAATRQLLDALAQQLHARESGALALRLTLHRYEADAVILSLSVSRATRDALHLWRLLLPQLEVANLGHGIEAIEVRVIEAARLAHRQQQHPQLTDNVSASHEATEEERGRLIDVLTQRLGPSHIMRFQQRDSHLPERAIQCTPMNRDETMRFAAAMSHHRPTQLFDQPQPVDVQTLMPGESVSQVTCVSWEGRWLRVDSCAGPERLTSEWWREHTGSRDYFAVALHTGIHLWLFRDIKTGRWFVHGWWA